MPSKQELMQQLNTTADLILTDEVPGRWYWWICYLLEAIEDKATPEAYTGFLQTTSGAIEERLELGQW